MKIKNLLLTIIAFLALSLNTIAAPKQSKPVQSKPQQSKPAETPPKVKKVVPKETTVYVTRTGAKYHSNGCQYLRQSQIAIGKKSAQSQGYSACSRCSP